MRSVQLLHVVGDPIRCDVLGCDEPAVIYLRQGTDSDNPSEAQGVTYCEEHWIGTARAYSPLVAYDTVSAVAAAADIAVGGSQ